MAKHNEDGARFEEEIAHLFRAAGYRVEQHAQLGGKEFDIVATRGGFGSMDVRIAVECKFRVSGAVTNVEANDFITAFTAARDAHDLTFGVIVSNVGFSRTAQIALRDHAKIRFFSRTQLDDELLGARLFLKQAPQSYRTDASNYIILSATQHSRQPKRVDDVAATCVQRLLKSGPSLTLLLGDFGSGKTTIAERVHKELAKAFLEGTTTSFPVILYLRTLDQSDSENNFIEQHLKAVSNQLGIQQLEMLRKRSGLTFILDGYDEVATNAREDDRLRLSSRVMRLIGRAERVLLTSRPTYFTSVDELNELVNQLIERDFAPPEALERPRLRRNVEAHEKLAYQFDVVRAAITGKTYQTFSEQSAATYFIDPLTREDVVAYLRPHAALLKRRYNRTPGQTYELLAGIYDVTDLLTRPLLLQMFVVLLRDGGLDLGSQHDELGPAGLYALYIELHLDREWNLKKFLTSKERKAFARTLAVAILEAGGSLEATYESLAGIVRGGDAAFAPARRNLLDDALADVVTDVRICAFINMTPGGRLEFSHKSFMEYFVAEVIIDGLKTRRPITILGKNLNYEILYFLGSFCVTWSDYRLSIMNHLRDFGSDQSETYRVNLKIALLFSERVSVNRRFQDFDFTGIRVAKRLFQDCVFENVALRNGQFFDMSFTTCQFGETWLEGEAAALSLADCRGAIGLPSQIKQLAIQAGHRLTLSGGEAGRQFAENLRLENCDLILDGAGFDWHDGDIVGGTIDIGRDATLHLQSCKIDGTLFKTHTLGRVQLRLQGGTVKNAVFDAVAMAREEFVERQKKFDSSRGLILVDDERQDAEAFIWRTAKTTRYRGYLVDRAVVYFDLATFSSLSSQSRATIRRMATDPTSTTDKLEKELKRAIGSS
ncbi:restriction endonuclease [Novosphingobium sp.]|uniref:restriction endonuclease n=1 Tax=Novosphingobium sp. TaxID=1874826 RepID=UPI0038BADD4D